MHGLVGECAGAGDHPDTARLVDVARHYPDLALEEGGHWGEVRLGRDWRDWNRRNMRD